MLQFPISVLTTSAILEGLQETLVSYLELTCDDVSDEEIEVLEGQAKRILVNVIKDIKDLMKIASVSRFLKIFSLMWPTRESVFLSDVFAFVWVCICF